MIANEDCPKVSVIIPTYNGGQLLSDAVQSVYNQTFKDWELIVVDDGSTEDIAILCSRFPSLKLITQKNGGVSVARNNGILTARAALIALLDHDDIWCSDKLAKQVKVFEDYPDAAMCFTDHFIIDSHGNHLVNGSDIISPIALTQPLCASANAPPEALVEYVKPMEIATGEFYPSSVMIKKSSFAVTGLFDTFLRNTDDTDAWLKLSLSMKILRLKSPEILYRRHNASQSRNLKFNEKEIATLADRYIELGRSSSRPYITDVGVALIRNAHFHMGIRAFDRCRSTLKSGEYKSFFEHLILALRWNPRFVFKGVLYWIGIRAGFFRRV